MDELLDELRELIVERQNIKDLIASANAKKTIEYVFGATGVLFESELRQLESAIASAVMQYKAKINQLIREKIQEIVNH